MLAERSSTRMKCRRRSGTAVPRQDGRQAARMRAMRIASCTQKRRSARKRLLRTTLSFSTRQGMMLEISTRRFLRLRR